MVVLNKIDLVEEEMVDLAADDVHDEVKGTFLEGAPILRCSGVKGEGIDHLKEVLSKLAKDADIRVHTIGLGNGRPTPFGFRSLDFTDLRMIAETTGGSIAPQVYHDPPARPGSVEDALANTLVSQLDLAPLPEDEAAPLLGTAPSCSFHRSPVSDPVLWADTEGTAALKLNGVLVTLEAEDGPQDGPTTFSAPGITVTLRDLGEQADWRQSAELVFALDQGLTVGYRGFSDCAPT